jgi:hypothetical protein
MMVDAMGSPSLLLQFIGWYLVVQLLALVALPLTMRLMARLPDRGYASAKITGILLVSLLLWLGYSYGLMRHDAGSAWLSVALVAVGSALAGRGVIKDAMQTRRLPVSWRYVFVVEVLFLAGFALWAMVRAYDPAINHTEQPMDLMFMNSIWASGSFPPQDAWLANYPVSYYYLGYWLLTVLARLAGQPPEIAYNLGQANWYGLLLIGSFGLVYNLVAFRDGGDDGQPSRRAALGGLLAAAWVAVAGNLQIILEWLYAHGVQLDGERGGDQPVVHRPGLVVVAQQPCHPRSGPEREPHRGDRRVPGVQLRAGRQPPPCDGHARGAAGDHAGAGLFPAPA